MERHPPLPMTPFDEKITTKQLQTLKLLLPYFPTNFQRMMGFYIKLNELQNVLNFFSNPQNTPNTKNFSSPITLFDDFRPYLTNQEVQSMDSILSLLNMMEMLKTMNDDSMPDLSNFNDMNDIMNMFMSDSYNDTDLKKGNSNDEQ